MNSVTETTPTNSREGIGSGKIVGQLESHKKTCGDEADQDATKSQAKEHQAIVLACRRRVA